MKARAPYGIRGTKSTTLRGLTVGLLVCIATFLGTAPAPAQPQATPLDPPDLICPPSPFADALDLQIFGGAWGTPNGFVLQWQTTADFQANGWPADGQDSPSTSFCSATFTGAEHSLDAGELFVLRIGKNPFTGPGIVSECSNFEPLQCGTEYRFRAKSLASANMTESPWSFTLGCSTDFDCENTAPAEPGLTPYDPPDLVCPPNQWFPNTPVYSNALILTVLGGGWGGNPAGFIIQWQTRADLTAHGWPADGMMSSSPSFCSATFTGPQYSLDEGEAIQIQFGLNPWGEGVTSNCSNSGPLTCGQEYVFRAKGLGDSMMSESWWSSTLGCFVDCENPPVNPGEEEPPPGEQEGCTFTQGYWKNHEEAWPVTELTLGTVTYTQEELLQILRQPVRRNGLVSLAHQLIAAKLNVANGASDADIAMTIEAADALIGSLEIPPIGDGSLRPNQTSGLVDTLASFNEGDIGPGHCDDNGGTSSRRGKNKNR